MRNGSEEKESRVRKDVSKSHREALNIAVDTAKVSRDIALRPV